MIVDTTVLMTLDNDMASGDLRYLRTVFRAMPSSPAIPRMERPAPLISWISFTCPTFSKVCRAPPRGLRE